MDVIAECDCFHTQLDLSLLDVEKYPYQNRPTPCSIPASDDRKFPILIFMPIMVQ